ncbi:protein phosphatase 1 regulatory subunit 37 isoform X1 [Notolabrus celidotus]|uniref:protein phosphatase 1 regulatory subunit 37 isoform X1 n=1 Tax=Notolabrus celidotus TaxID=1203425 RepID=UPI00148F4F25|nr:protein phosphatase 1 regulatory subunit 37 isoform X1 [Notolabrus celidotus]XP_034531354.1 protein phosphatase 1 regulatory subunit 37 isoform X1 [Notolabrus celidotus]XP_034531355.1 protein phosphatase 1 regulatory subunit 37 isoform X1 [Notolabrus celidotus]
MTGCSDEEEQSDEGAESNNKKQKKKRSKGEKHVSFPPDELIVSGFAEHRDNDRKGDSCVSLVEVVSAYELSCSRHQVEPKECILQQLQQGVCVGGGVKCLDLKGERLDQRSCEALEAVLKSLHFDFINLQAAQLEENGAASLLDMILYYESTTHLDMSDSGRMGTPCWRALAHLIKQSVRLCRLDVCNVPLVDYPAQSLSKALLTSRLTVLHLHNGQLSGVPLYALIRALKSNQALRELHLSNNQLNSYQDALQLGDLLRYNNTLQTLQLSNNAVADAGLEELCEGLRWQTAGLKVLLLRNNQITADGMVHLARALPLLKVLQVLDLGENLVGNEGIQVIREPLMQNVSVLQLGLQQTSITCEGAVALAEFLAESRHIQQLDLRQNEVKVGGLMALCLALRINRSLTGLDLDHRAPQEQDEFLTETQTRLQSEIVQRCIANATGSNCSTETSMTLSTDAEGHGDDTTTA